MFFVQIARTLDNDNNMNTYAYNAISNAVQLTSVVQANHGVQLAKLGLHYVYSLNITKYIIISLTLYVAVTQFTIGKLLKS